MTTKTATMTRRDRQAIARYLREMASDTHTLLHLADANLCGDIAAILRARANRLEMVEDGRGLVAPTVQTPSLYAQT